MRTEFKKMRTAFKKMRTLAWVRILVPGPNKKSVLAKKYLSGKFSLLLISLISVILFTSL